MEARLERLFERYGLMYPIGAMAASLLLAAAMLPIAALFPADYFELATREWAIASAVIVGSIAVLTVAGTVISWRRLQPGIAWCRGYRTPELVESAGTWAYRSIRRSLAITVSLYILVGVPASTYGVISQSSYSSSADVVAMGIVAFTVILVLGLTGFVFFEFGLQPIRASIGRYDVAGGQTSAMTLALVATPLLIIFVAGSAINFLTLDRAHDPATDLLESYGFALLFTAIAAIPFLLVVLGIVIAPLRRLRDAHRAVEGGDLSGIPVFSADEVGELVASFNQMVAALKRTEEALRASRARIVASSDESRRRVERDLHDGAQQNLVLLNLKLGILERRLAETEDADLVAELRAELDRALAELRDLAHGIYPQVLTSDGLGAALAEVAPNAVVDAGGVRRYAPEVEAAVYFCCLEALQNAGKYAGEGASVRVVLAGAGGTLRFEVADDGVGFDPAAVNGSAGLQNIRDRIGALGGEVEIESAPGRGTTVAGSVPVEV